LFGLFGLLFGAYDELSVQRNDRTAQPLPMYEVTAPADADGLSAEVTCHFSHYKAWCQVTTDAGVVIDRWQAVRLPGGFYRLREF
jgi:hypothetical protein